MRSVTYHQALQSYQLQLHQHQHLVMLSSLQSDNERGLPSLARPGPRRRSEPNPNQIKPELKTFSATVDRSNILNMPTKSTAPHCAAEIAARSRQLSCAQHQHQDFLAQETYATTQRNAT